MSIHLYRHTCVSLKTIIEQQMLPERELALTNDIIFPKYILVWTPCDRWCQVIKFAIRGDRKGKVLLHARFYLVQAMWIATASSLIFTLHTSIWLHIIGILSYIWRWGWAYITLFTSITTLCGTNNIMWNILAFKPNIWNILYNIVSPTKYFDGSELCDVVMHGKCIYSFIFRSIQLVKSWISYTFCFEFNVSCLLHYMACDGPRRTPAWWLYHST